MNLLENIDATSEELVPEIIAIMARMEQSKAEREKCEDEINSGRIDDRGYRRLKASIQDLSDRIKADHQSLGILRSRLIGRLYFETINELSAARYVKSQMTSKEAVANMEGDLNRLEQLLREDLIIHAEQMIKAAQSAHV